MRAGGDMDGLFADRPARSHEFDRCRHFGSLFGHADIVALASFLVGGDLECCDGDFLSARWSVTMAAHGGVKPRNFRAVSGIEQQGSFYLGAPNHNAADLSCGGCDLYG